MTLITKAASKLWNRVATGEGFEASVQKLKLVSANDGKCTAELTVDKEHVNVIGSLHGGAVATIVDVITSVALSTVNNGNPGVSVDIHVSYLRKAPLGQQIVIEAKTNKVGRTLAFMDVVLKRKDTGELVATGSHTAFVAT